MKRLTTSNAIILTAFALTFALAGQSASYATTVVADEHFSVREYDLFHDVLSPLQHEALPKKDFATIRARAPELVTRGRAIVRLGVPARVRNKAEFKKALKEFDKALMKFKADARKKPEAKSDARLEEFFTALHDSFERLAGMLPIKVTFE